MEKKIRVLVVEPDKPAYEKEILSGLKSLQSEVGGWIEAVYPFEDDVAIVCNEEGKILNLPPNRPLYHEDTGEVYDILAGTFLVVGVGEEDFIGLDDVLMKKFKKFFAQPVWWQDFRGYFA